MEQCNAPCIRNITLLPIKRPNNTLKWHSPLYCLQREFIKRLMIFTDSTQDLDSPLTDALSKSLLKIVGGLYKLFRSTCACFSEHNVATKLWRRACIDQRRLEVRSPGARSIVSVDLYNCLPRRHVRYYPSGADHLRRQEIDGTQLSSISYRYSVDEQQQLV